MASPESTTMSLCDSITYRKLRAFAGPQSGAELNWNKVTAPGSFHFLSSRWGSNAVHKDLISIGFLYRFPVLNSETSCVVLPKSTLNNERILISPDLDSGAHQGKSFTYSRLRIWMLHTDIFNVKALHGNIPVLKLRMCAAIKSGGECVFQWSESFCILYKVFSVLLKEPINALTDNNQFIFYSIK